MIDIKFVEKLLDLLNSSDVGSIEVKRNLWSTTVRVSKAGFEHAGPVTYRVSASPDGASPVAVPSASRAADEGPPQMTEEPAAPVPPVSENVVDIKSPMVGTFYAQPEPGAEPYVQVGSAITPGQTLCVIEAMKIMNPIDAEVAGVIKEVCVQDTQPVEFGHVLFKVDPNG